MRSKYLRSIATFLIALMVSLPIYSSVVFASLSNPSVKGIDDIEGYVREYDTATLSVDAEITGDSEITTSQVHLADVTGPEFDSCIDIGQAYRCSYSHPNSSKLGNPFELKVLLLNDDNTGNDNIIIKGYKDVIGPKITTFDVSPTIISNGNLDFDFKIEDRIYDGSSNKCIGIRDLIVTAGTYSRIIPINSGKDNCIFEDSFSENIGTITSITSGDITIEAIAYDNFNQESSAATVTISVDKTKPTIDINSFKILDNNNEIHHVAGRMTASASVTVDDSSGIASVKADFSSLKASNRIMTASCNNGNCKWNNIEIDLTFGGDKEITINATDNLGNSKIEPILYYFEFDNTDPIITILKTNYIDSQNKNYFGKTNNTIIVEIEEAGTGFNNKNIYLDLGNINNAQNVQADSCIQDSNIWRCYWYNIAITTNDGTEQISIKANSADDLGNIITGTLNYDIIIDRTNPVINEITYTPPAPTSSDTLIFNIKFSDASNEAQITVDSSSISTTPIHTDYCMGTTNCAADVNDIVSSYTVANVHITVSDPAGNKAILEKEVTIYQADINSTPQFFSIKDIELIPSRIDRKVASQIPISVFVHVTLQGVGSGRIIGKTVDCAEMANYLAASPYLMNEYEDDPYIAIKTNQAVGFLNGSLLIKCKLRLKVRDNQHSYSEFEEEDISVELELYGNALGNLGDAVKEKLDGINEEIQDVDDDIEKYEKWIGTWGRWCQISQALGTLNSVLQAIKSTIFIVLSAAWWGCFALILPPAIVGCQKLVDVDWTGICTGISDYQSRFIEMFIWPTGYIGPGIIGMINKFSCMIAFHCAMCNINEIFSLTMDIGMHALATTVNTAEGGDKSRIKEGSEVEFFETEPGYVDDVDQQVDIFTLKSGTVSNIDSETGDLTVELSDGTTKIIPSKSATPVTTTPQATAPTTDKKAEPKKVENKHPSEKGKAMSSDIKGKAGEKLSKGGFRKGTDSKTGNNNKDWEYNYEGKPNAGDMTRHTSSGRQYVYKGNGEDEGWQRMYTGWEEQGLTTTATPSTEWLFNPYKSIHYAKSCLCLPAIVYNLEKEKQIKCMQRNCITNRITEGLPTTDCDVAYKERYCLYVEGAEFKKHGYSGFMDNIWEWAKDNSAFLAASLGYVVGCFEYIVAPEGICAVALATGTPAGGWYPSMCGLYGSAMGLMELYTTFASEFSFLNYDQELEGEDYCASGNYQE